MAAFRVAKNLSQTQLGAALGMKRGLVAYYERSARNPSLELVEKIAAYFGVSVAEMLNDTAKITGKPGPASQIEQLAARAAKLPRAEQKMVIKMLEGVLPKAS